MRALSTLLTQLLCLAALLLAIPAPAAASEAASLGSYLNQDGTMNLPKDFVGSLNPAGFRMVQGKGEAPRFVDENAAQAKSGIFGVPFGCNGTVGAIARVPSGVIYMGGNFTVFPEVGSVRFSFTDGANMQMSYTLDGVTQTKNMTLAGHIG